MLAFIEASRNKSDSSADLDIDISASALAVENPLNMKSKKAVDIVHKLMTRAINEGREEEMIQQISRRITKVKNWAAQDAGHIKAAREMDKLTKSRTLRIFNFNAMAEGRNELLSDHTGTASQLAETEEKAADRIFRSPVIELSPLLN